MVKCERISVHARKTRKKHLGKGHEKQPVHSSHTVRGDWADGAVRNRLDAAERWALQWGEALRE